MHSLLCQQTYVQQFHKLPVDRPVFVKRFTGEGTFSRMYELALWLVMVCPSLPHCTTHCHLCSTRWIDADIRFPFTVQYIHIQCVINMNVLTSFKQYHLLCVYYVRKLHTSKGHIKCSHLSLIHRFELFTFYIEYFDILTLDIDFPMLIFEISQFCCLTMSSKVHYYKQT